MFVGVSSIGGQELSDLFELLFPNDRLMLGRVSNTFMDDLSDVLCIGQDVIDGAAGVRILA